jgi:hypothetical protein
LPAAARNSRCPESPRRTQSVGKIPVSAPYSPASREGGHSQCLAIRSGNSIDWSWDQGKACAIGIVRHPGGTRENWRLDLPRWKPPRGCWGKPSPASWCTATPASQGLFRYDKARDRHHAILKDPSFNLHPALRALPDHPDKS